MLQRICCGRALHAAQYQYVTPSAFAHRKTTVSHNQKFTQKLFFG
jgi:hypothetical protein